MDNENDKKDFELNPGIYLLPEYDRLLSFPNFKPKLVKKLKIKRDTLINKHSIEKNSDEPCTQYLDFMQAEINLITYLLKVKDVKDVK
jgi:hypothetical protein